MKSIVSAVLVMTFLLTGCAVASGVKNPGSDEGGRPAGAGSESRDECLRAIRRARIDARSGIYRLYVLRQHFRDERFARFLSEYARGRYGIEMVMYDAEGGSRDRCYSNEMEKIIMNKFGPGIMSEAEEEARELFAPSGP